MNMNFQKPQGFELGHPPRTPRRVAQKLTLNDFTDRSRPNYFIWLTLLLGGGYLLANASLSILLAIGGAVVVLLGIATAICIYAQNNSPW
jgi:hypothetical protein